MSIGSSWRALERNPTGRRVLFCTGVLCLLLTPIVAPIPGPGGIPLFLAGITLLLRNSKWAKRRYVRLKRRWPRQGKWVDHGLRRRSVRRRAERVAAD
jgi:hypothetical protein